jgi:hypothetical protein
MSSARRWRGIRWARANPSFNRSCACVSWNLDRALRARAALLQELGPVPTIAKTLQNRVVEIARWTRFSDLKIMFESSDRADPLIKEAFQDFGLEEDGRPIPVDCYFMPKSAGDPALEVADFIMHAVGRQARKNLKQRDVPAGLPGSIPLGRSQARQLH